MVESYLQKDGESFLDWKLRLIVGKIDKAIDLDWVEIRDLLKLDCSPDHLRKTAYGAYEYANYVQDKKVESVSSDEFLQELEQKKLELQKEKYKIQTLRLDLNKNIRENSRYELLFEEFINELKNQKPLPHPEFKELKKQNVKKAYLLSFADAHYGKYFESITNQYDLQVVYDRFNKLFNEVLEIIDENNIEHLTIVALGDLLEGLMLRQSQLSSLRIGLVSQTIEFMRFITAWLNKLSEYVNITYYQTVQSNHTQLRPFGSKPNEFVSEDMERVIFAYVQDMLESNPRIKVVECKEKYLIFNILQFNIIAGHGHGIKEPKNFIKDASDKYRIFFDYALFGHLHHNASKAVGEGKVNNCEVINIPSIMGCDEYADDLMTGSKAGATLIEFTEKQGKRKMYDIILN